MGIFWHADFSELLNENTAYLGKSLQKKFCRLTFFFFFKECQLRYCEFNFKRQHLLARKSEAITNDDTLTQWFSGTLQSRFSEISELIRITKTLTSQCQGWEIDVNHGLGRPPWNPWAGQRTGNRASSKLVTRPVYNTTSLRTDVPGESGRSLTVSSPLL